MEIRNAVFQGPFNRLIRELAELPAFRRIWDIPTDQIDLEKNALYRKMSDIELILRFFALSHHDRMDMKFKDYLSDFLDARNKEYVATPAYRAAGSRDLCASHRQLLGGFRRRRLS